MNNQNSLKRMIQKHLSAALILLLLPGFAFAADTLRPAAEVQATTKPIQDIKIQKNPLQKQGSSLVNPQKAKPALKRAEATAKPSQGVQMQKSPLQKRGVRSLNPQNFKPISRSTGMTAESLRDAEVHKSPLQKQGITLLDPQNTKPVLRSAEITHLDIGTESDGRWYWEATIKNTGNAELDGQDVVVQGYKLSLPQSLNTWTGASGQRLGIGNFFPNQSRIIKMHWERCCLTDQLKVDLLYEPGNSVLNTETLTSLLYSYPERSPLNVRLMSINWDNTIKAWLATLKNFTDYTVKLEIKGLLQKVNTNTLIPASESIITLGPHETATSGWHNTGGPQANDKLFVHMTFLMGENSCNESNVVCGYLPSKEIILPNYNTAFAY